MSPVEFDVLTDRGPLSSRPRTGIAHDKAGVIVSWSGPRNAIHGVCSQFLGRSMRQTGAVCLRNSTLRGFYKASPGFEPTFLRFRRAR